MTAKVRHLIGAATLAAAALVSAGCGELSTKGHSPVQLIVLRLEGISGADPSAGEGSRTLQSDVITLVTRTVNGQQVQVPSVFNDNGFVELDLVLKDPGDPASPTEPSSLNQVTITRYRVVYRRTDGRNTPGIDVPYPFDSAVTFSVTDDGPAGSNFQLVRHSAKEEAPLAALRFNSDVISTIAEVTFFGHDQAGNDISVSGMIGVDFGNFGDPQ